MSRGRKHGTRGKKTKSNTGYKNIYYRCLMRNNVLSPYFAVFIETGYKPRIKYTYSSFDLDKVKEKREEFYKKHNMCDENYYLCLAHEKKYAKSLKEIKEEIKKRVLNV